MCGKTWTFCKNMRLLCVILFTALIGCSQTHEKRRCTLSTIAYVDSDYSRKLTLLINRIESGDGGAWSSFVAAGRDTDGEYSQTFSVACSELLVRSPHFLLAKYVDGDKSVTFYSKTGYQWSDLKRRSILETVFDERKELENNEDVRDIIGQFIRLTCISPE